MSDHADRSDATRPGASPARPTTPRAWAERGAAYLKAHTEALADTVRKLLTASGEYAPGEVEGVCEALTRGLAGPLDDPASSPSVSPSVRQLARVFLEQSRVASGEAAVLASASEHVKACMEGMPEDVRRFADQVAKDLVERSMEALARAEDTITRSEEILAEGIPVGDLMAMMAPPGEGAPPAQGAQPGENPFNPKRDVEEVRALLALADSLLKGRARNRAGALDPDWSESAEYWVREYAKAVRRWETEGTVAKWRDLLTQAPAHDADPGVAAARAQERKVGRVAGACCEHPDADHFFNPNANDWGCTPCGEKEAHEGGNDVVAREELDDPNAPGGAAGFKGAVQSGDALRKAAQAWWDARHHLPEGPLWETLLGRTHDALRASADADPDESPYPKGRIDRLDAAGVGEASPSRLVAAYLDLADACEDAHPAKAADFRAMADEMAAGLDAEHRAELRRAECDCAVLGDGGGLRIDCPKCRRNYDEELEASDPGSGAAGFKGGVQNPPEGA